MDDEGRCWRALSLVPGQTLDRLTTPTQALEAGRLVGRWHQATAGLEHTFLFSRPGAHDTPRHMAHLEATVDQHRNHRLWDDVSRLARDLLEAWASWQGPKGGLLRLCHGDLKGLEPLHQQVRQLRELARAQRVESLR